MYRRIWRLTLILGTGLDNIGSWRRYIIDRLGCMHRTSLGGTGFCLIEQGAWVKSQLHENTVQSQSRWLKTRARRGSREEKEPTGKNFGERREKKSNKLSIREPWRSTQKKVLKIDIEGNVEPMEQVWQKLDSNYQKWYQNVRAWFVLKKSVVISACDSIVVGMVIDFVGWWFPVAL